MSEHQAFKRATRRAAKIKLAIQGPSGSGKTLGALALAHGLANGGKVAVIDTENGSASLYADKYEFDTLEISPPYLTKKYEAAIKSAVDGGYAALVIDSISHQWEGDGGILQRKDEADARPGSNHWTNWGPFTKEHNEFRSLLLSAPIHVLATMRSKMAYTQSETNGKKKIEKLGLQPIQREGMEYEFWIAFDVQMDHIATASKDRTGLFKTGAADLADPKVANRILAWLDSAAPIALASNDVLMIGNKTSPWRGRPLKEVPTDKIAEAVKAVEGDAKYAGWTEKAADELELRRVAAMSEGK